MDVDVNWRYEKEELRMVKVGNDHDVSHILILLSFLHNQLSNNCRGTILVSV